MATSFSWVMLPFHKARNNFAEQLGKKYPKIHGGFALCAGKCKFLKAQFRQFLSLFFCAAHKHEKMPIKKPIRDDANAERMI